MDRLNIKRLKKFILRLKNANRTERQKIIKNAKKSNIRLICEIALNIRKCKSRYKRYYKDFIAKHKATITKLSSPGNWMDKKLILLNSISFVAQLLASKLLKCIGRHILENEQQ
jgi:hypothetical protein